VGATILPKPYPWSATFTFPTAGTETANGYCTNAGGTGYATPAVLTINAAPVVTVSWTPSTITAGNSSTLKMTSSDPNATCTGTLTGVSPYPATIIPKPYPWTNTFPFPTQGTETANGYCTNAGGTGYATPAVLTINPVGGTTCPALNTGWYGACTYSFNKGAGSTAGTIANSTGITDPSGYTGSLKETCQSNGTWANTSGSCTAPSDITPTGSNDGTGDCISMRGWACDGDNFATPLAVRIYEGGTSISVMSASVTREQSVANLCGGYAAHGLVWAIPASLKNGVSHTLTMHAIGIDSSGVQNGNNPSIGSATFTCSASTYSCSGSVISNAVANNISPLTANGTYTYSTTAGNCKYKCDSTHTWNGSACIASYSCSGSVISGAVANNISPLTANGTYTYSTTAGNCKYKCDASHSWNGSVCVPNTTAPDLTAGSVSSVSTTYSATIRNIGNASTGAGFTNLFQKADTYNASTDVATNVQDIGTSASGALVAGGTAQASLTYPSLPIGTSYLRVCADKNSAGSAGTITESNENNNCGGWTAITITTTGGGASCTGSIPSGSYEWKDSLGAHIVPSSDAPWTLLPVSNPYNLPCKYYTSGPPGGPSCTSLPPNATPWNSLVPSSNTAYSYSQNNPGSTPCMYYISGNGACGASHYYCTSSGAYTNPVHAPGSPDYFWTCPRTVSTGSDASCSEPSTCSPLRGTTQVCSSPPNNCGLKKQGTQTFGCSGWGPCSESIAPPNIQPSATIQAIPNRVKPNGPTTISITAAGIHTCTVTKNGLPFSWSPLVTVPDIVNADQSTCSLSSINPPHNSFTDIVADQSTYKISCDDNNGVNKTATQIVNVDPNFYEF
jgi:hypothetical protein